jgi:hypothetical protein
MKLEQEVSTSALMAGGNSETTVTEEWLAPDVVINTLTTS